MNSTWQVQSPPGLMTFASRFGREATSWLEDDHIYIYTDTFLFVGRFEKQRPLHSDHFGGGAKFRLFVVSDPTRSFLDRGVQRLSRGVS